MAGKIFVIEGTDGSGKQTQTFKLYEKLLSLGKNVKLQSFPNYSSDSCGPVKMYLSGKFGDANSLDAYQASSLFAVDRLCTMQEYIEFLKNDGILLLDRYVESNMIHQAGKLSSNEEIDSFITWLNDLEFEHLKLPKPNKIFFLDVPVEVSKKLANARTSLKVGANKDVHEEDKNHLENAYRAGKYVAKKFNWTIINCIDSNNNLKSIEEIHNLILKEIL